ncbi:MAG: ABC transporter ATP-binding protein [Pirellulaceae bacterium]
MSHLIELHNICKSYKSIVALHDVSLTMDDGITGLLGPNGAGKSTLIKVLMGLVKINGGTGTVLGHDLLREGRKIRAMVGYMPEDDCYITGMTGIEMVRFSASLAGIPPIEALRRAHEILDFCGVHQERYRSVEGYSTGMRQKTKFAAAIVHDPLLLILDEPTSGLDPEEREALLNRVRVLCEKFNKSALISTHILPDVQAICDHVVILSNGEVKVSDRLDKLNDPTSPLYIATVIDHADRLESQLVSAGVQASLQDDGTVAIMANGADTFNRIWQVCDRHEIVLKSLVPTRNSIEEIFMEAIKGDEHAHS